ncbi:MAG: pilus assembly protein N-terminal domain-containing protein, partial [Candidatus Omnitrophica bacterium]|nr:pilus assembly protein N-terminal domain-containing protein [Candidatus Omnitrophota bacterium]
MRKKFLFFGLFCLFVSLFASPQDLEEIKLIVGETKSFPAQSPTRIVIGNPEISDALSVSEKRITLVAKSKGITNFFFWDKDGEHNFRMKVIPLDIEYLNKQVKKILKYLGLSKVYTKLIEEEGRILILGSVGSENDKVKLKDALGGLAENVTDLTKIEEEVLVEISVEVLELTTGAKRELGFKWPTTVTLTEPAGRWGTLAGMPDALFRVTDWTRATFEANLDLLIKKGEARLLSRPRIVCQSGREAELLVGGEVPIITTQTVSDVGGGDSTQVEYKEYGIKLNINPQVLDKGKVQLSLKVEISEVGEAETLGDPDAPTAKAYPLTKRNVSTQLYLDDGEILAIG